RENEARAALGGESCGREADSARRARDHDDLVLYLLELGPHALLRRRPSCKREAAAAQAMARHVHAPDPMGFSIAKRKSLVFRGLEATRCGWRFRPEGGQKPSPDVSELRFDEHDLVELNARMHAAGATYELRLRADGDLEVYTSGRGERI